MYLTLRDKMLTTSDAKFTDRVRGKWRKIEVDSCFEYMDDSSFWLNANMAKQDAVLVEDVPLAPLDAVIGTLEQKIEEGLLRTVHALRLGYVCYLDEGSPDTYSLYPMWVCDCRYAESAGQELEDISWSDAIYEQINYEKMLIDAQTCEVVSGWLAEDDDMFHEHVLTWDDV